MSARERDRQEGSPPLHLSPTHTNSIRLHLTRTFPSPSLCVAWERSFLNRLIEIKCTLITYLVAERFLEVRNSHTGCTQETVPLLPTPLLIVDWA